MSPPRFFRSRVAVAIVTSLCLFSSPNSYGQTQPQETIVLDLPQAASLALACSPRLRESLERLQIARESTELLAAPARFQASVETGARVIRFPDGAPFQINLDGRLTELRPLASGPFGQPLGRLKAQQLISDGGRIAAQLRAARFKEEALAQQSAAEWNRLYWEISQAFITIEQLREESSLHQLLLIDLQKNVDIAQKRYQTGDVAKGDIIFAQVPLSQAEFQTQRTRLSLDAETEKLKALIGLGLDTPIEVRTQLSRESEPPNMEMAVSTALSSRPDLVGMVAERASHEESIQAAQRENKPRVYLAGEWNPAGFQPTDLRGGGYEVGLVIQWPLVDGGVTHHSTLKAQAEKRAVDARLEQATTQVELEVREALRNLILAKENLTQARVTLDKSEEAVRIARGQYQSGFAGILELRSAELDYHQARLGEVRAQADLQRAYATLDWKLGETPRL